MCGTDGKIDSYLNSGYIELARESGWILKFWDLLWEFRFDHNRQWRLVSPMIRIPMAMQIFVFMNTIKEIQYK